MPPLGHRLAPRLETLTAWRAVRLVVTVAFAIMALAAVLIRLAEPHTFTGYGVSLWWAIVTVATVGYGDYVPHTVQGRMVASATILFSMALIPTVTSLVVAALVARIQRERGVSELARLDEISARLASIERRLEHGGAAASSDGTDAPVETGRGDVTPPG